MSFKMHKIAIQNAYNIIFFREKKNTKNMFAWPDLKFPDLLPETHLTFYLDVQ